MVNLKGWLGLGLFFSILLFSFFGPLISGHSYDWMTFENKNLPPSLSHWFGTDELGRDLFTRTAYGVRVSLLIGISAAIIDIFIGVLWGSLAAFSGRLTDTIMMRFADALYVIPYMLVVIVVMMILGGGLLSILVAMTVTGWITMARIIRGRILLLKEQEFVLVSQVMGAGFWHLLRYHFYPNIRATILVTLALTIPNAIFTEAFIGFLGLGNASTYPSLGTMVNDGLPALTYYPWRLFFPATMISLIMLSIQLLGEELNVLIRSEEYGKAAPAS